MVRIINKSWSYRKMANLLLGDIKNDFLPTLKQIVADALNMAKVKQSNSIEVGAEINIGLSDLEK